MVPSRQRAEAREKVQASVFGVACDTGSSETDVSDGIVEPLDPIASAITSFANGDTICALIEIDSADSSAIVTRPGSSLKAALFS